MEALKKAKQANPSGRWFLKADATDMQIGLRESMKGSWTGDCDFGDGELQKAKKKYDENLGWIRGLGLNDRKGYETIASDLKKQVEELSKDVDFLATGMNNAKKSYEAKKKQKNVAEQTMFGLAWDVEGFKKLLDLNAKLTSDVNYLIILSLNQIREVNIPKKMCKLRKDLEEYVNGITLKKRDPASHLLVFMISDKLRSKKLYAIPVRALPYNSMTDSGLRMLKDELKETMSNMGMVTVGKIL